MLFNTIQGSLRFLNSYRGLPQTLYVLTGLVRVSNNRLISGNRLLSRMLSTNKSSKEDSKQKVNYGWNDLEVPVLGKTLLTSELTTGEIGKFWRKVVNKIGDNNFIMVIFRVKYAQNAEIATIGVLQQLNKEDKDYYVEFVTDHLSRIDNKYKDREIMSIIFSYGVREGKAKVREVKVEVPHQNFNHYKLPLTTDPLQFGSPIVLGESMSFVQVSKTSVAVIRKDGNKNHVQMFSSGYLTLEFTDTIVNENTFVRKIGKNEMTVVDGEIKLYTAPKKSRFINSISKAEKLENKNLTLDIETKVTKGGVVSPFLVSVYDGIVAKSFYISDYVSDYEMLISAVEYIMVRRNNYHQVYVHNLAGFDAVFLIRTLSHLGRPKIVMNKGKLISIGFTYNSCTVVFKDSYQLLPSSLNKLASSFGVHKKEVFPMGLLTKENTGIGLNYVGELPVSFFGDSYTQEEINNYNENFKNKDWSFRAESIKYCEQDCKTLYDIVERFSKLIYNLYGINISKFPTISSLTFGAFRANHLKEDTISQLTGTIYRDIKKSYTGGTVDMYIPEGENLYSYDFNSLYPSVMAEFPMPISDPVYFEGNIRDYDKEAQGVFYCKITAPMESKYPPILQTHVKGINGTRTVAALGSYYDWVNTYEMDNATNNFGYQFEIIRGYTFKYEFVFKDFVVELYETRKKYPKTNPMNLVAKTLLNSLYGRFGMDQFSTEFVVVPKTRYLEYEAKHINSIVDIIDLDESLLIELVSEKKALQAEIGGGFGNRNINIAIATHVSACGRIKMANLIKFLVDNNYKLYYKDTDCVFIDKPLPEHLVSNTELGKLKLEHKIRKGIFLSPKVYYLETEDSIVIKVKGLNTKELKLTKEDFESLLNKDVLLEKEQTKWFRSIKDAQILLKRQLYTLKVTSNKRELIYDSNNRLIATKPLVINEDKTIY
jgi:DNA polymerase elongation subunit (family B)